MSVRLQVASLVGGRRILSGSLGGKQLFVRLVEAAPDKGSAEPLFIDFGGIDVATASFLRESVVALKAYCRQRNSNLFPVAANLSDQAREELEFCLRATDDIMLCCEIDDSGSPFNVGLAGNLDPKIERAYLGVQALGEADASSIWKKHRASESVTVNAWNNRLAELFSRGVVTEEVRGRSKFYRPVLKEK